MAENRIVRSDPKLPAITPEKLDLYLSHLALTGLKRRSAVLAGIEPTNLWGYRARNDDLAARELEAMQFYYEIIEETIHNRAINGVEKGVYYEGQQVATERVYSDRLLMLLARRHIPEYREHTVSEVNVKAGVLLLQAPVASSEEWAAMYEKGVQNATNTRAAGGRGDEINVEGDDFNHRSEPSQEGSAGECGGQPDR